MHFPPQNVCPVAGVRWSGWGGDIESKYNCTQNLINWISKTIEW